MIYRELYISKYDWLVHVFYHVTCYWTDEIMECLENIDCPEEKLEESYRNLTACRLNTGLTYSNYSLKESVMVIGKTSSAKEFSDSLMHELRHLEDHIATVFDMPVGGEEIAYLSGYLGKKLSKDAQMFICDCDCHKKNINNHIHKQQKLNKNGNKSRFKDRSCQACNRFRK